MDPRRLSASLLSPCLCFGAEEGGDGGRRRRRRRRRGGGAGLVARAPLLLLRFFGRGFGSFFFFPSPGKGVAVSGRLLPVGSLSPVRRSTPGQSSSGAAAVGSERTHPARFLHPRGIAARFQSSFPTDCACAGWAPPSLLLLLLL